MASVHASGNSGVLFNSGAISQQPLGAANEGFSLTGYTQQGPGVGVQPLIAPKKPSANSQTFYCEICCVSCSSQGTFNDHLAGQKHKKKVANRATMASGEPAATTGGEGSVAIVPPAAGKAAKSTMLNMLFCDLCSVSCCGPQAFAGHMQGAKHQKALKLQAQVSKQALQTVTASKNQQTVDNAQGDASDNSPLLGEDYVSSLTNDAGNVIGYHCNLCDCTLTDPNGRIAHMKGRRHKTAYKLKFDPSVHVDPKPRTTRHLEMKEKKRTGREEHWRRMDDIAGRFFGPGGFPASGPWFNPVPPVQPVWGYNVRNAHHNTVDDKYIYTKRDEVRLPKAEVDSIYAMAIACEKALKMVSDVIAKEDNKSVQPEADSTEQTEAKPTETENNVVENTDGLEKDDKLVRSVRGVMRVGRLATGVFLLGDYDFDLVVLVKDKPTWSQLERIARVFTDQLVVVSPEFEYKVQTYDDGCIRVIRETDYKVTCTISVTSPCVRQLAGDDGEAEPEVLPDPEDMIPKEKCLEALAQLRRTKWYQVRCSRLYHCGPVIRVFRNMCRSDVRWSVLNDWAQELLVEKCICYAGLDRGPAEILRTIFECIASGLLTTGGAGLYDPCEKDSVDVTADLTVQQREDITAAAQQALRLIAYRQIYKVLDMKQFPKRPWQNKNKRGASSNHDEDETQEKRPKDSVEEPPVTVEATQ